METSRQEYGETLSSVDEDSYTRYLSLLLKGKRLECADIVAEMRKMKVSVKTIYQDIFQRSLYKVGELWEFNKISVATEHMTTSLTEGLMNRIYVDMALPRPIGKKAVIASVENELHQVGAKMVADIFEMRGWSSMYLGADTPTEELLRFIRDNRPDAVGLSLTVYSHMGFLEKMIQSIQKEFPDIPVLFGGQAFRFGGESMAEKYPETTFARSLDDAESFIEGVSEN